MSKHNQNFNFAALVLMTFLFNYGCAQTAKVMVLNDSLEVRSTLLYEENFNGDLSSWQVEQMPGGIAKIKDEKLEIDDVAGCTIWFKKELSGPIMIEYDAYIISDGGENDRVSDMNCFWMAKDVEHPNNLFENSAKRHGKFTNYDSLRLYYMGVGGHDNTKTRFRRYVGNGERPLLAAHNFSKQEFLLEPNTTYHIKIIAYDNVIQYYRNGVKMIDLNDDDPYTSGYFGFRTVNNHMTIDNFKVYRLKQ